MYYYKVDVKRLYSYMSINNHYLRYDKYLKYTLINFFLSQNTLCKRVKNCIYYLKPLNQTYMIINRNYNAVFTTKLFKEPQICNAKLVQKVIIQKIIVISIPHLNNNGSYSKVPS